MKRNITVIILILVCLVAMLAGMQQVEAKSTKHIPQVTLYIKQNPTTGHNYFAPTFPCIRGRVANVTIKNTTKQPQVIDWWSLYKFVTIPPGKSITSVQHASGMNPDNSGDYQIDVVLNYKLDNPPEAEANIIADGVVKGCIR